MVMWTFIPAFRQITIVVLIRYSVGIRTRRQCTCNACWRLPGAALYCCSPCGRRDSMSSWRGSRGTVLLRFLDAPREERKRMMTWAAHDTVVIRLRVRLSADEWVNRSNKWRGHGGGRDGRRLRVIVARPSRIVALHLDRGRRRSCGGAGRQRWFHKVSASGNKGRKLRPWSWRRGDGRSRKRGWRRREYQRVRCWSDRREERGGLGCGRNGGVWAAHIVIQMG